MCAKSVQHPRAVVERSRINFATGDEVVCQQKNSPTDTPYIQNYAGRVGLTILNFAFEDASFVVTPLGEKKPISFEVVDELPDDWGHRILRKR